MADDVRNDNVTELNQARAVIVIWSAASVSSPQILHEAIAARDARKLLHVKDSGLDGKRIPVSLRDQVVLDAHDLPSIARAVAGILGSSPAVRQSPSGDAQSVVDAGPRRDPGHALLITRRTRETAQEAIELRVSLRRVQLRRGVLSDGLRCLAALAVVVLFGNVLTNALSSAQSGLTRLLPFLN